MKDLKYKRVVIWGCSKLLDFYLEYSSNKAPIAYKMKIRMIVIF